MMRTTMLSRRRITTRLMVSSSLLQRCSRADSLVAGLEGDVFDKDNDYAEMLAKAEVCSSSPPYSGHLLMSVRRSWLENSTIWTTTPRRHGARKFSGRPRSINSMPTLVSRPV